MLTGRFDLQDLIQSDWKNESLKKQCVEESRSSILKGQANRAFDYFPNLVDQQYLAELSEQLRFIIQKSVVLPEKMLKNKIMELQKNIAEIGCQSLFDPEGTSKQELLDLCEWNDIKQKINTLDLLCGYIGAVNQQIISQPEFIDLTDRYRDSFAPLSSYCNENQNYRTWALDVMRRMKLKVTDGNAGLIFREILMFPRKNPALTASIVGGLVAAATLGISLFVVNRGGCSDSEGEHLNKHRP